MYANSHDDGTLMNSYIEWSRRLEELHQQTVRVYQEAVNMQREDEDSEEPSTVADLLCPKCRGDDNPDNRNGDGFPHIQDLCPGDRRRIARLIKQLIKCTKEMRGAKAKLAVNESEKNAMRSQYETSIGRLQSDKKQLEFELSQSRERTMEFRLRISRTFELLTRQVAEQETQFIDLAGRLTNLVREKSRLEKLLAESQARTESLQAELQRTRRALETERLLRSEEPKTDPVRKFDRASQTQPDRPQNSSALRCRAGGNCAKESLPRRARIKGKDDLDQLSAEGTLLRDLFFKKTSVGDSDTSEIIPILSRTDYQTILPNAFL